MSEEQLSALLAKLKEDGGFREKLQGAGDLDAAVAMAKEAGFDLSKADWLKYQATNLVELSDATLELSDEELERVAGGLWKWDKADDSQILGTECSKYSSCYASGL